MVGICELVFVLCHFLQGPLLLGVWDFVALHNFVVVVWWFSVWGCGLLLVLVLRGAADSVVEQNLSFLS